jgi:hypothetical protein
MTGTISIFAIKLLLCIGLFYFAGMIGLISCPLLKRQVSMNHWYGIRFAQAFYSDENWYEINAYGGKVFIIWAIFVAMAGIILFIIPIDSTILLLTLYLSVYASLIIPIIMMAVYADHFKREPASDTSKNS